MSAGLQATERAPVAISVDDGFLCPNCAAFLSCIPGTESLACAYCKYQEPILPNTDAYIGEIDYASFLAKGAPQLAEQTVSTVHCESCGAISTRKPNLSADRCPFCGTGLVSKDNGTSLVLKPQSLLPFSIDKKTASVGFQQWVKKQWFAPNDFQRLAKSQEELSGMYLPYFTFDSSSATNYTGKRGDDSNNGKQTSWSDVYGHVDVDFNDVLIVASSSLPKKYTTKLEPWDLHQLRPYDHRFLSGFQAETYQIQIPNAFDEATSTMKATIEDEIRRDMGGNRQRIESMETTYTRTTFKHILLPIWISSYRYKGNVFRFLVNGRTGEVQGERPYSWIKISLALLLATFLIIAFISIFSSRL